MRCSLTVVAATLAAATSTSSAGTLAFVLNLDPMQETNTVVSTATGSGTATLNTGSNLFTWNVDYLGLTGPLTAAHFHGAAPYCETAGVAVTISNGGPASGNLSGSATLSPAQVSELLDGLWYVNLHTALHTPGEIRAQVVPGPIDDPLPDIPPGTVHVQLTTVASGLTAPNFGATAPGHAGRLFVTDQPGTLWNVNLADGTKAVMLDVSSLLVTLGVFGKGSFDERGLLGVAFHPDYQANGLLYTYTSEAAIAAPDFTTLSGPEVANHHTVIREWNVVTPADPDAVVNPGSTRVVMTIAEPQFNHNAGCVNFGPDDMLYISLGDGGGADDQDGQEFISETLFGHDCIGNGADPGNILGTIVRIDPQGSDSANGQYGIPGDNPFVGVPGFVDEIFAYGFRNPFRFSFDQVAGDLYVGDVGQNHIEEIDIVTSGGFYGWNLREGSFDFIPNGGSAGYVVNLPASVAGVTSIDPIAEYDHDDGIAILGGFVYRGVKIPALDGLYVFAEFAVTFANDGRIFHLDGDDNPLEFQLNDQPAVNLSLLGLGQDTAGEVYVMANDSGVPFGTGGVVLRIAPKTGDLDANGIVDTVDFLELLAQWGLGNVSGDLDMNGVVDTVDFLALLANWG